MSSALTGFHKLSIDQRQEILTERCSLSDSDISALNCPDVSLSVVTADTMIENYISRHILPVGVATNFIIDGHDVFIPMAIEEPSVIAGASFAAKLCRPMGGFRTAAGLNICTGQAVFLLPDTELDPVARVQAVREDILTVVNATMPSMVSRGGGCSSFDVRKVETDSGLMLVIDVHANVIDAMGANAVTGACEALKIFIGNKFSWEPLMGILTNLSQNRIVHATAKWRVSDLTTKNFDGSVVAERIIMAANFAKADPGRGATHRKGIMNGITAVVEATGNDTRAVEAAIHTYALTVSKNPALTEYYLDDEGNLVGEINIPVPVGTVGGSIKRSQSVMAMKKLMGVDSANDLAKTIAAVGLAQNFAAIRALVTAGISEGHMKLHSRNIACNVGAVGAEIDLVAEKLRARSTITAAAAREILTKIRCNLI